MPNIIPAILTNSAQECEKKLSQVKGLVNTAQIDIMDNKFVPNISFQIKDIIGLDSPVELEAHLMIENPELVMRDCQKVGFKRVIFHFEATSDPGMVLDEMDNFNFQKGIALNPETKVEKIAPFLDRLDMVLFLTVNPGFYGSPFIPEALKKIKELKKINPNIKIEVDGGIKPENIKQAADAGADDIVVGSAFFRNDMVEENLRGLKKAIE